jgi:hypothetical protein
MEEVIEVPVPPSLQDIINGLTAFGLEDCEDLLTIKSAGRDVQLKISNVPTSDEIDAVMAADEFKGYLWIKRVKVELLSRSISWINGINLRDPALNRFIPDPTTPNKTVREVQVVLRNLMLGWGQEVTEILWKVLMTHSQRIEDRMKEQFPESAIMTEVEQRLFDQAKRQIDEINDAIIKDTVASFYDADLDGPLPEETNKS